MRLVCCDPFFAQPSIATAAILGGEKLVQNHVDYRAILVRMRPQAAVNPFLVAGDAASWRSPAKPKKPIISAVLGKRQVRRVRLKIIWVHGEIGKTHSVTTCKNVLRGANGLGILRSVKANSPRCD